MKNIILKQSRELSWTVVRLLILQLKKGVVREEKKNVLTQFSLEIRGPDRPGTGSPKLLVIKHCWWPLTREAGAFLSDSSAEEQRTVPEMSTSRGPSMGRDS